MIDPVKVVLEMLKRSGVTTDLENDIISPKNVVQRYSHFSEVKMNIPQVNMQ